MTKKDYKRVATAINRAITARVKDIEWASEAEMSVAFEATADTAAEILHELCETFAADNPQFDKAKFLVAVGV